MEFGFAVSGFPAFMILMGVYVFTAFVVMTIANKLGVANSWMAWVPILNIYLLVKMAGKPGWWLALFLVPFINFFVAVYVWMLIAERRGRPQFWGLLMIVPVVNLILMAMLAFTEPDHPVLA
ncbi:MAG: hypothetical protein C4534_03005 [Gaiellales bacterium]|nr:MAG: hypothetical protein C4534_03005 [Gaiellales bacterium]